MLLSNVVGFVTSRCKVIHSALYLNEPPHDETNKISVRPAKTKISLGIRPV